ncbi:MAG: DNA repair protein RecO [Lentisphaeraceae bacterium]|nr:DNA repair protein RecO [Lentisphaeraceae bacterium]
MLSTEVIVLRTINYGEDSTIIHALCGENGRLNLLARGARRVSKKKFPQVGLFRILAINARAPSAQGLRLISTVDLIANHDQLANKYESLDFACALSQLSLSLTYEGVACPLYYYAFIQCLTELNTSLFPFQAWVCRLLIIILMEQGQFPEMELSRQQKKTIIALINDDLRYMEELKFSPSQWSQLYNWMLKIAVFSGIELPQSTHFLPC